MIVFVLKFEGLKKTVVLETNCFINGVGTGHALNKPQTPLLLRNLLSRERAERALIVEHPAGGIRVQFPNSEASGVNGVVVKGMYVIGELCYGS